MIRIPRRAKPVLIASVSLVTIFGLAQPAAAKGGPRPKPPVTSVPAPTPTPAPLDCFTDPALVARTPADVVVNYAGDAGCVGVTVANGTLRLAWVELTPGWTYVVKGNGVGTNTRIQIDFTNAATGQKIPFRFEFGKTAVG